MVTDLLPACPGDVAGLTGLADDPVAGALRSAITNHGGIWVGRSPDISDQPGRRARDTGRLTIPVKTVSLAADDIAGYDAGHARQTIWPLYHDLVRRPVFDNLWREAYRRANWRFAAAAASVAAPAATVWVHDYHLQLVPAMLRRLRPDLRIGFFLHTSFPPADLFTHMPMRQEILTGILGAHVIGFQTDQAAENFVRLWDLLGRQQSDRIDAHPPRVAVFPTSVDSDTIETLAASPGILDRAARLRAELADNRAVLLSLDRADAAMGTERRLRAMADLFASRRLRPEDVAVVQVVTDGPGGMTPDASVRARVEREVARINGDFASLGHPCVHYVVNAPTLPERVALYRAADVMMATPLREATSVPALEYVAARLDTGGALVLSEFSGTASALPDAYLVNPYDEDQTKAGLLAALEDELEDQVRRMKSMREYVCGYDAHAWVRSFLLALRPTGRASTNAARYHRPQVDDRPGVRWLT